MEIEVSNGEIVDKLSILQIKTERIDNPEKLVNIKAEYNYLKDIVKEFMDVDNEPLYKELYEINCQLWDIEDKCRELEMAKDFGDDFVATTRSVYLKNDDRAKVKKQINLKTESDFVEEKSY
jgi:hypothetical protein